MRALSKGAALQARRDHCCTAVVRPAGAAAAPSGCVVGGSSGASGATVAWAGVSSRGSRALAPAPWADRCIRVRGRGGLRGWRLHWAEGGQFRRHPAAGCAFAAQFLWLRSPLLWDSRHKPAAKSLPTQRAWLAVERLACAWPRQASGAASGPCCLSCNYMLRSRSIRSPTQRVCVPNAVRLKVNQPAHGKPNSARKAIRTQVRILGGGRDVAGPALTQRFVCAVWHRYGLLHVWMCLG